MRSALSGLVTNLQTDTSTQLCSFTVNLDELDIAGKLNEFAKTNKHIAGWSLVSQEPAPAVDEAAEAENDVAEAVDEAADQTAGEAVDQAADDLQSAEADNS